MKAIRGNILDTIGNTSMLALRSVVPGNGTRILLKLESENPTGSIKDRAALAMIEAAAAGHTGAHKIDGVGAGFVVPLWQDGIADQVERVRESPNGCMDCGCTETSHGPRECSWLVCSKERLRIARRCGLSEAGTSEARSA